VPPSVEEDGSGQQPGELPDFDPPEHTRLRRMLTPEFTVRRINRLRPWIEEIVTRHLEAMEQAGPPTDLVAAFALPVPSLVICELLGVPYADREQFQRLSSRSLDFSIPEEQQKQAYMDMLGYMATLVARQRRAPDEAMLGMLVREHGDDLTDAELTGIGNLLLFAGHETTANMVGLGTLLLLEHPEQLALLRDDPAPETVERAVEELLRYLTVVNHGVTRTATEDVVLGRQRIKAGEHVMVSLPTANRDETVFQEPDRLNLTRKPEPHVAFGHGIHHCLGAPWRGWRCGSPSPRCYVASPGCAWPSRSRSSASARCRWSTGSTSCQWPGSPDRLKRYGRAVVVSPVVSGSGQPGAAGWPCPTHWSSAEAWTHTRKPDQTVSQLADGRDAARSGRLQAAPVGHA
jgi:hypothetical protein